MEECAAQLECGCVYADGTGKYHLRMCTATDGCPVGSGEESISTIGYTAAYARLGVGGTASGENVNGQCAPPDPPPPRSSMQPPHPAPG